MNITTTDRRIAATEQFERAKAALIAVFDTTDALRAVLADVALSSTGVDPLRASADVEEALPRLRAAVAAVRQAAVVASAHASKGEVAAHADTKPALLFPRPDPVPARATPARPATAPEVGGD